MIQINQALLVAPEGPEKNELLSLKANIEELLELTNDCTESNNSDKFEDEFAAFMAEMQNEGSYILSSSCCMFSSLLLPFILFFILII